MPFTRSYSIDELTPELLQKLSCGCEVCVPDQWGMILCPECGSKRCPRATWHEQTCTGSNEPGQAGSSYGPRDLAPKSLQEYWDQLYAELGND